MNDIELDVQKDSVRRNLVVLLDGTGNELGRNLSNVLKLYRLSRKTEQQKCYYNPGVGTIGRVNEWHRFSQKTTGVLGLATGYGLDDNVLGAYKFLVENWQRGDRIFLFGFSRGAWSVRVLAGFLHLVGLLQPEQLNLCDSALGAYKRAASDNDLPFAWHFSRVVGARRPKIHFIGAWDSVGSVLVPRRDRFYLPSLQTLPYTLKNPSVKIFRHALAIDERRRMFRVAPWTDPQPHCPNPYKPNDTVPQDIEQRWFAGVHSDIGGGYPEEESQLSKYALRWMVDEAEKAGLLVDKSLYRHLVCGEAHTSGEHTYVPPAPDGMMHRSLGGAWRLLEVLPKKASHREWQRRSLFGFYLPLAEPRKIEPGAIIDPSVSERQLTVQEYKPVNLPDSL
ncbi:MAG: DUF2235 domain-containing protein [Gammaproteobacteria bacterium]|nr:DUF2235 domain-containing protein [Gammaproteobacteria bacterium]